MSTWLYQISPSEWSPERYRFEIWEGERWRWLVGKIAKHKGDAPKAGDIVAFFYTPTGGTDPGFYGWAVVLDWYDPAMTFRPAAPSDFLKMYPWGDAEALRLANKIRGNFKQGTMWRVSDDDVASPRAGIRGWLAK
jgi:hypothetical protein